MPPDHARRLPPAFRGEARRGPLRRAHQLARGQLAHGLLGHRGGDPGEGGQPIQRGRVAVRLGAVEGLQAVLQDLVGERNAAGLAHGCVLAAGAGSAGLAGTRAQDRHRP